MSGDDWQVGDLAVLIDGYPWRNWDGSMSLGPDPTSGGVYEVVGVDPGPALWLKGFSEDSYSARSFRKIKPDTHEPCEEEFRILLQLSKKRVSA